MPVPESVFSSLQRGCLLAGPWKAPHLHILQRVTMTSYSLPQDLSISLGQLRLMTRDSGSIGDLYQPAAVYIRLPGYPMYPLSANLAKQKEAQEAVNAAASHWCSFGSLAARWLLPDGARCSHLASA